MYSKAQKTISYITIKERQKKNKKTCKRDKKTSKLKLKEMKHEILTYT